MFLTCIQMAKTKSKSILVMLESAAGTGSKLFYRRNRLKEKYILRKFDKRLGRHAIFIEKKKIKSM
ncbi:large ribosomal subunit protein bL33m-like [Saccoglossus kowalevskii]